MVKIHVEVLPGLAETLGVEATSEEGIPEQEIEDAGSVRGLLNQIGARHQRFRQIVFDGTTRGLSGRVAILLNGRGLELVDGLETKLKNGDTLTIIPVYEGG